MKDAQVSLLLIEHDGHLAGMLRRGPTGAYQVARSLSIDEALDAARSRVFDAVLVDVECLHSNGLDAIGRLKATAPDTEVVVVSAPAGLASALQLFEREAFAFVQKQCERSQLL
jgi:two-component system response regulator AtoC